MNIYMHVRIYYNVMHKKNQPKLSNGATDAKLCFNQKERKKRKQKGLIYNTHKLINATKSKQIGKVTFYVHYI